MRVDPEANRTRLERPTKAMFNLAVDAVMTGQVPLAMRDLEPMKVLWAIAYVFFLEASMKGQRDVNEADKATVTKHFHRACQRAEALLANEKIVVPRPYYIPTTH